VGIGDGTTDFITVTGGTALLVINNAGLAGTIPARSV